MCCLKNSKARYLVENYQVVALRMALLLAGATLMVNTMLTSNMQEAKYRAEFHGVLKSL